ncbi:LacI family transcriptional regulator [Bifidobacterium asteroides]|nr:LacI family transcriptional regulator [Bifidobacterium asteroides]
MTETFRYTVSVQSMMLGGTVSPKSSSQNGKNPTLADVAGLAGVSIATVSKVINGKSDVADKTRERVEEAIDQLGYFKSDRIGTSSNLIELALQHLDNPWTLNLLDGAAEVTSSRGIRLVLSEIGDPRLLSTTWLDEVLARRPLGAILIFSNPSADLSRRFASRRIPAVFVDPWGNPVLGTMSVQSDNWSGGLFATRHLIELGHQRIGTITGPDGVMCSIARLDGYRTALHEAGLESDPRLIRQGQFSVADGERFAMELLNLDDRPTAIFAQSDFLAMGVYKAAKHLGISIPDELSVVGFDDIQTAAFMGPALTTIHQPLTEMAARAAKMILDTRSGKAVDPRAILPNTLVVRESTCPPPNRMNQGRTGIV